MAASLAIFSWTLSRLAVCQPISDMIPLLTDWLDSPGGILPTLWLPLNEHHLLWLRLLLPADFVLTGGWPVLSGAVSILLLGCLVWLPVRALRRTGLPCEVWWAATVVLTLLVFATPAAEDTAMAINGVYPQAAGLAMLCLAVAAAEVWWLAFLLAITAAFGNGVALVLFPILSWQAWRAGARFRLIATLAIAGAAFCWLYVGRNDAVQPHALPDLMMAVRYAAAMLGLPTSHSSNIGWLGTALGAVLGVFGIAALILRPTNEVGRLAQGGILFGLGAAALGALGRTDIAGGLPALRYTALVLPLQIGLFCLAVPWLQKWLLGRSVAILLVLSLGLLGQSALAARAVVAAMAESRDAVARFSAGQRDAALTPYIYPNLAQVSRVWNQLQARGLPVCRQGI